MNLATVIFSKDSPAQLDLLLRSIERFVPGLHPAVIYKGNGDYRAVIDGHSDAHFIPQGDFAADTVNAASSATHIQFMVDDDVFVAAFDPAEIEGVFESRPHVASISLRLDPTIWQNYCENLITEPPAMNAEYAWWWPGLRGDWGYPSSIDGNIFRAADILPVLHRREFHNPNELEPALMRGMGRPLMQCLKTKRIINVPNTSVQTSGPTNRNGGLDAAEVTRRFAAGERIQLEPIVEAAANAPAPHWEIPYQWA